MSIKPKTPTEMIPPITLEYLREHKNFCKLKHKQDKELLLMKKKHAKEQTLLGEQQSKTMSKVKAELDKTVRSPVIQTGYPKKDLRYALNRKIERIHLLILKLSLPTLIETLRFQVFF